MADTTKKRALALAKELRREIAQMEEELDQKKSLLSTLSLFGVTRGPGTRGPRRAGPAAPRKKSANGRRRRAVPAGRKSHNRDIVLAAASRIKGRFSLAQLRETIHESYPRFGGKYASGTIINIIKKTPEISKVKRGLYLYKG